jgi:16S rRNA (cytosine1402-N4)-methyltransferase
VKNVDGILADLGVSSVHSVPERVSTTVLTPDMRMSQKNDLNANRVVNDTMRQI